MIDNLSSQFRSHARSNVVWIGAKRGFLLLKGDRRGLLWALVGGLVWVLSIAGCSPTLVVTGDLADDNNYSFTGALDVPLTETVSGQDVELCWEGMSQDIRCHDVDPVADIDNVSLVRFPHLEQEEIEAAMSAGTLQQADISGYVESRVEEETCTALSDMSFFGTEIDVAQEYTPDAATFLLLLTTGTEPAVGTRMLSFLEPKEGSGVSRVDLPSGCGVLDFEADLQSLSPLVLWAEGPWDIDWSGVTTDGQGLPNDFASVDRVSLAFYATTDLGALEAGFLDLELLADRAWEAEVSQGTSLDLADLQSGGEPFGGFHGEGLWILGLRCGTCVNPAPLLLTLVEPVEGSGS